jgi:hypothetical protein
VRVLRLEWLTRLPVCTPLPVSSQRRDICFSFRSAEDARVARVYAA